MSDYLYFVALNYYSLKRKSTTMAKRQSFILESKSIRANKPKTEQSKLQGKLIFLLVHLKDMLSMIQN